jgi:hypothetical protein
MHSDMIREAARRLEEAAATFRFKARAAREEYGELLNHWTDGRSRKFAGNHIDPQHGLMEQGERLCLAHSEAVTSAHQAATSAESEISAYRRAEEEFEHFAGQEQSAALNARNLAARCDSDSTAVENEVASLNSAIASALQDPGW